MKYSRQRHVEDMTWHEGLETSLPLSQNDVSGLRGFESNNRDEHDDRQLIMKSCAESFSIA